MAEFETRNEDHPKTEMTLAPGETVALCRCFKSQKFPFCDGSHRDCPGKGPAIVHAPSGESQKPKPDPA